VTKKIPLPWISPLWISCRNGPRNLKKTKSALQKNHGVTTIFVTEKGREVRVMTSGRDKATGEASTDVIAETPEETGAEREVAPEGGTTGAENAVEGGGARLLLRGDSP